MVDVETLFPGTFAWYVWDSDLNHRVVVKRVHGLVVDVAIFRDACGTPALREGRTDALPFVGTLPPGAYFVQVRNPGIQSMTFPVCVTPAT